MPFWKSPRKAETMRYTPTYRPAADLKQILQSPNLHRITGELQSLNIEDGGRVLVLTGPLDDLHRIETFLRQIDIKPREVRLDFQFQKAGKTLFQGTIPVAQSDYSTNWYWRNLKFTFMPHVNLDDSVAIIVELGGQKQLKRLFFGQQGKMPFDGGILILTPEKPTSR